MQLLKMPDHRAFKKPESASIPFGTHVLAIRETTSIIGVCGIGTIEQAAPEDDGWFISDFFAFKHLLAGLGSSQTWLLGVSPETLVEEYGEYLHGSSRRQRKVVLNRQILEGGSHGSENLEVVSPANLLSKFLHQLALKLGSSGDKKDGGILLLVFGHGDKATHDITLGPNRLSLDVLAAVLPVDPPISVSMITTACYSGAWAACPRLNISAAYGAASRTTSYSWAASDSLSRSCGSPFASALIESISGNQPQGPQEEAIVPTMYHFADGTRDAMKRLNGRVLEMSGLTFGAANDDWGSSWCQKLGIPPDDFKSRWGQLETREPGEPGCSPSASHIEPTILHNIGASYQGSSQPRPKSGSDTTPRGLLLDLRRDAEVQLRSVSEMVWNAGHGNSERSQLRRFLKNPCPTIDEIEKISRWLEFRKFYQGLADELLIHVGAKISQACKSCLEFNVEQWLDNHGGEQMTQYHAIYQALFDAHFWPSPGEDEGWFSPYPLMFMAAVLTDSFDDVEAHRAALAIIKDCPDIIRGLQDGVKTGSGRALGRLARD
ncbi:hypothetical protein B0T25DRAFT_53715 [Lasiosphaeria hispida]|uniref:Uncharacterized protein n=1 Tax=Lasiosphaeria hispida TaxID=260671 RepID=A0AAJ0HWD2_9PEZI|nr:hypothetical protein B0T25DRAFT_53715 [Lasiosphaeria hispida]